MKTLRLPGDGRTSSSASGSAPERETEFREFHESRESDLEAVETRFAVIPEIHDFFFAILASRLQTRATVQSGSHPEDRLFKQYVTLAERAGSQHPGGG